MSELQTNIAISSRSISGKPSAVGTVSRPKGDAWEAAQSILTTLENNSNDGNARVNRSVTLKDTNDNLLQIAKLGEEVEVRLSIATSYAQDLITRCHMKALEDKWVDVRGPINDTISRCA